ncbi:SNF1-interacting protein [Cryomyces antarcticus]|nr:SNF1-interacting protein [Cryomyces antarcticus]
MAEAQQQQAVLTPVGKPLSLIPVGLKEAALDSPTFRATAVHFSEQIDLVEKWLDNYVKAASKLASEVSTLEALVNTFLAYSTPPAQVSEATLDHDYTLLAIKRCGEGAREFWSHTLRSFKKSETILIDPIRVFLQTELRNFKDARRVLEQSQKTFDGLLSRYAGQTKSKEPSSLREDAFQLHESRKAYLKASMDFCVLAPHVRAALDRLLVKTFADQWREMKNSRDSTTSTFTKWGVEMERVRGWSRDMESSERAFKRELQMARKQLEDSAEYAARPSRELEDYSASTVAFLGSGAPSTASLNSPAKQTAGKSEKQGWLFLRSITGKPARTVWSRRWFFVKNGIFGWLVQGIRSGGVEESEKIGVLLCNVRPAFQEERRFCFEVKTKDTTILLQAETQSELAEWVAAFDIAKRRALEDPRSTDSTLNTGAPVTDAAFAISPPIAPEFAAKHTDGYIPPLGDDSAGFERIGTLPVPDVGTRSSSDVSSMRRATVGDRDGDSGRDHAARIIQKLDLHRKSTASPQLTGTPPAGGIASLISASHNILPVGPGAPLQSLVAETRVGTSNNMLTSTLAPSTLANPPAPTNLSKTAVVVSGERGVDLGRLDVTGGMPSGIMANLWGSTNWGYINRLERGEIRPGQDRVASSPSSPAQRPSEPPAEGVAKMDETLDTSSKVLPSSGEMSRPPSPTRVTERRTISLNTDGRLQKPSLVGEAFPNYYPVPLKAQDAQFRMLFPNVPRTDKVVLVFRATWNPNEQQEFPGRVYVTEREIYFYSHHLGLVLISGVTLKSITDVTAATGRDCDFLYLHLKEGNGQSGFTRITIKTFLEPLKLLQRRLNFLVQNCNSEEPKSLEEVLKTLIKMEVVDSTASSGVDSWDDASYSPIDEGDARSARRHEHDVKASIRIDGNLFEDPAAPAGKDVTKFKLPSQPVVYAPQGMTEVAVEKEFHISAKALFHVMFGDKSAVFQMLYRDRWASSILQTPWTKPEQGHLRRNFEYETKSADTLGRTRNEKYTDYQVINVLNDHLCYVVTDKKTPWHLPRHRDFMLTSKFVITHVAKSRCKLAVYTKVDWIRQPTFSRRVIERQALGDLTLDAQDVMDVVVEQAGKLGSHSSTNKAIQIYGHVGQATQATQCLASDVPPLSTPRRFVVKRRTLSGLVFDNTLAQAGNLTITLIGWIRNAFQGVMKICTAHTIMVGLLVASMLFNSFYSYRDTSGWWNERNAGRFMARVGVKPNAVMSKAVYMKDVDDILSKRTDFVAASESGCRATFRELLVHTDMDSPHELAGSYLSEYPAKATARRLHRTRQHLGSYRHDLLVAMRVVNNIEQEMIKAEWENWLLDENVKCRRVGRMLSQGEKAETNADQEVLNQWDGVEAWYQEYCGSCKEEWDLVNNATRHLALAR